MPFGSGRKGAAEWADIGEIESDKLKVMYILEVYRSSASADIRMNFDIRIRNISCGCHADIANNKRIIF